VQPSPGTILGVELRKDPATGCFYMWTACRVWAELRMARLLLGQARSNLAQLEGGVNRAGLGRELAEGDCLTAVGCLLRAHELREQRRLWRAARRWLTR
jgi:hypothetical protein